MSAAIGKQILTFCKLSSVHRITGGIFGQRHKSLLNTNQDLRQEHVEQKAPERIDEEPGPWKNYTDLSFWRRNLRKNVEKYDPEMVNKILREMDLKLETENDMPVDNMVDPYTRPPHRCILCQHNISLNYKNVQLLSQFVSPYTGRIYGRQITGLCLHMQRRVAREIRIARSFGFMPFMNKAPQYLEDPALYNPFKPKKTIYKK